MSIGRVAPHNLEAEQSLLGAMILDKDAIGDASELISEDDFYRDIHKEIFESIVKLYNTSQPVDLVTLSEILQQKGKLEYVGGIGYLAQLTDVGVITSNASYYAKIIMEKSVLRRLIKSSTEIIEKSYDETETAELLNMAEKNIFDISQKRVKEGFAAISDVLHTAVEQIEKYAKTQGNLTGLTTGFRDLDRKTSGLQRSDLILVAARPSMGKTAFSINVCQNAAIKAGASVAIFSLEMSKEQLVQRMLASEAQIPIQNLRTGNLTDDEWPKLVRAMAPLAKSKIFIDDTPSITVTEMRAKCRRLKMEHGLEMIMIDYLQLMGGGKAESRQQEISMISRSLKALAREMDCPVVALSQLSRAPEQRADHRPILSDLRESGAIEQDADIVMFLYRDEYYFPEKEDNKGLGDVIIAKQRNGETGTITLNWFGQYTKFVDSDVKFKPLGE
jgi:replicative DNA helicase